MGTRSHNTQRCPGCRLHLTHCLCAEVTALTLRTRVVVIQHRRERSKTTATAHLAQLLVPALQIRQRGWVEPLDLSDLLDPARRCLILFPGPDARPLTAALVAEDPRPTTLVVPDGSWRQASKMPRREPLLRNLARVSLPPAEPSRYQLRREPVPGGLATVEAIARALGMLEGPEVQQRMEALFHTFVERTLVTRAQPPGTP
jgi:DTW domain-containing protein